MMTWIIENGQILSTLGSAIGIYIFMRKGAKKDVIALRGEIQNIKYDIQEIRSDLKEIKKDIHSLDSRISRIDGHLMRYYYYEPKIEERK